MLALGAALVLMVRDAAMGGDWPGWDEGWALVVFPLGIPFVLYTERLLRHDVRPARAAAYSTLAMWFWGAVIFGAWHMLGT